MESHLNKRRSLKGRITRIERAVSAQGSTPWDKRSVKSYLQQLDQLNTELSCIHAEIGQLCNDEEFVSHQNEYDELVGRIETAQLRLPDLEELPQDHSSTNGNGNGNGAATNYEAPVRLPRLELPTFSGNLHDWTSFHDLFSATINSNERLAGAQKLQYLKSSLRGEAALLVQSIQVTDDNFVEAWEILKRRYNNRREIINAHLKRLCSQPALTSEAPAALRKLIDVTSEVVRALRVLQVPVDHWDILLTYLILEKLDPDTRRQWELTLTDHEVVRFDDLLAFLEQRARALLSCGATRLSKVPAAAPDRRASAPRATHHVSASKERCRICHEAHSVYHCSEFLQSSIEARRQLVKDHALCFNCLSGAHQVKICKSSACRKCGGKHHTLLHLQSTQRSCSANQVSESDPTTSHLTCMQSESPQMKQVLLATALVNIQDNQGRQQVCRALLDSGSQAAFVTEACAQRLGLPKRRTSITVKGISASNVNLSRGVIELKISSRINNANFGVQALVLKKVTGSLPSARYDTTSWNHVPAIKLADPNYNVPNAIDVLLGADVYAEIVQHGIRKRPQGTPTTQNSSLGWLISGRACRSDFEYSTFRISASGAALLGS